MRQRGFTIVEVMISLGLLSIILMLGVPSMLDYFANARVRALADDIQTGLQQAKFEAINRNAPTTFTLTGSSYTVSVPAIDGNAAVTVNTRAALSREAAMTITPANASVGFNSLGQITPAATLNLAIADPTRGACQDAGGSVRCLNVIVNAGGQMRICDPALPSTNPRGC